MTIQELEREIEGHKVLRHQFQCFINVYSEEEALGFAEKGAHTRPAGGQTSWGTPTWEVFLAGMLDSVMETKDDLEVDVTPSFLLDHFRKRDGFSGQGRYATLFS